MKNLRHNVCEIAFGGAACGSTDTSIQTTILSPGISVNYANKSTKVIKLQSNLYYQGIGIT